MTETSSDSITRLRERVRAFDLPAPPDLRLAPGVAQVRLAYAAAHVVRRAGVAGDSRDPLEAIDWPATLAFRHRLWSLGFGVAEAMDTAQRDVLGWRAASELLDRTLADARRLEREHDQAVAASPGGVHPPRPWPEVMGGAGVDGLPPGEPTFAALVDEYVRQGTFIQERGGSVILLANAWMPRLFPEPARYAELYREVARQLRPPLFVHWLGEMFAPALAGYFPDDSFFRVMEENADRIRGVKLSLLDEAFEISARRRLRPFGQVVLTGDDYNYPRLILGEGEPGASGWASNDSNGSSGDPNPATTLEIRGRSFPAGDFSHALLGVFDAIAPVAARALNDLARGDVAGYRRLMEGTEPLGRALFEPPTSRYKAGVIFLAWLNGFQDRFAALGDLHLERSPEHYVRVFELAANCGALLDPASARERMLRFLEDAGR